MTKPVLAALNLDKEFRVETDASKYTTGKVLSIKCLDEKCKSDWGTQDFRRILSDITVCDYDTTYLQKNPQRLG